jgi:glycosyltransferase involved in cell wall biosynthesis
MKKKIKKPKVSILIAALNEEKNVKKTVEECFKIKEYEVEVLVVLDNKTTDDTKTVAEKAGARVIQTGRWKGKGAALRKANKYISGELTVQIDADYQFLPRDIPRMLAPLQNGYDVTLGSRYRQGSKVDKNAVTKFRRFGIIFLSLATSAFSRQIVTDVLAGFKAFRTPVLIDIDMQVDHYGYEAEVVIKAAQKGYKILDVPVHYKKRETGKSNVMPLKHGFMFLETILKVGLRMQ